MKQGIINGVHNGIIPQYNKIVTRGSVVAARSRATSIPLSNMALWVSSDYGVLTTGSNIYQWNGKSININNPAQGTAINQPTFVANQLNGYPAVQTDGTSDFLTFTEINNIRTFFVVIKHTTGTGDWQSFLGHNTTYDFAGGVGAHLWDATYTNANIIYGAGYVNGVSTPILSMIKPVTAKLITIETTGNVSANQIAEDRNIINHYWNGQFFEIIIYTTVLSTADRLLVESYLMNKYAL